MEATPVEYAVGVGSSKPFYKTTVRKHACDMIDTLLRYRYVRVYVTQAVSLDTARNRREFLTS